MILTASLDIGTAHMGECLMLQNEILHLATISMPNDFASTKARSTRLRGVKRRKNKKLVEFLLWEKIEALGLPVLKKFDDELRVVWTDPRLNKEFAKKGDQTIFASCALKVKIMEEGVGGLEPWQISKAIYSLLKRRGYDGNLPWKNMTTSSKDEQEEAKTVANAIKLLEADMASLGLEDRRKLPAYRECMKLNLLNTENYEVISYQGHNSEPFKVDLNPEKKDGLKEAYFTDRKSRVKEARLVLAEIAKPFPDLDPEEFLFGKHKKPYASHAHNTAQGRDSDLDGIFGIKIPRFNNRSPNRCILMPDRNTVRKDNPLFRKFTFLNKVYNLRIINADFDKRPLKFDEFKTFVERAAELSKAKKTHYKLTKTQIKKILKEMKLKPAENIEAIEPASNAGRAAFCSPALKYLIRYYLEGKNPKQAKETFLADRCNKNSSIKISENEDSKKGLTPADFDWLGNEKFKDWQTFYITPTNNIEVSSEQESNRVKIVKIISDTRDPVVRHRLQYTLNRLTKLDKLARMSPAGAKGIDRVAIELCRDSFTSKKSKERHKKIIDENKKEKDKAKATLNDLAGNTPKGVGGGKFLEIIRLLQKQEYIDLYTGEKLSVNDLDKLDVDHIVPRSRGGNSSAINKIVTSREFNNHYKGTKTPHEYFRGKPQEFREFKQRVRNSKLGPKKKELLVSPTAAEDLSRLTDLTRTAHIAKKLQDIIYLYFGWKHPQQGGKKRVFFFSGGLVAKYRRMHRLDRILYDKNDPAKKDKKNRNDLRNHALDAVVIALCPDLEKPPSTEAYRQARRMLASDYLKTEIQQRVYPVSKEKEKTDLEENNYGIKGSAFFKYKKIKDLCDKKSFNKTEFSLKSLKMNIDDILINTSHDHWDRVKDLLQHTPEKGFEIQPDIQLNKIISYIVDWYNQRCSDEETPSEILEAEWEDFCSQLDQKKIALWEADVSDPRFKILKNPHGKSYGIKFKGAHKLYAIVRNEKGKLTAYPHYSFESNSEFEERVGKVEVTLRSHDLIRFSKKNEPMGKIWTLSTLVNSTSTGVILRLFDPLNPAIKSNKSLSAITTIEKVDLNELPYPPHL